MLGKAKVQISRIAAALHQTTLAAGVIEELIEDGTIPGYFDRSKATFDLLKHAVDTFKSRYKWTIISPQTAQSAVTLMNYYIAQKKIYTKRELFLM